VTFGRPTLAQRQEQRAREKTANLQALATIPAHKLHRGTYEGTTAAAVPKAEKAKPGKRTPNAAERAWMDWIVTYGCIACRMDGHGAESGQPRCTTSCAAASASGTCSPSLYAIRVITKTARSSAW
jgi:hypothetical protein